MFKCVFAAVLCATASAALQYVPAHEGGTAMIETNQMVLDKLGWTQSEWDAVVGRVRANDGSATAEDVQKYGQYTAEFEVQKQEWITKNTKTATAEEEEKINAAATASLTAQQQTDLTGYNATITAGGTPNAQEQAAHAAFVTAQTEQVKLWGTGAMSGAYGLAAAGAVIAAAAALF